VIMLIMLQLLSHRRPSSVSILCHAFAANRRVHSIASGFQIFLHGGRKEGPFLRKTVVLLESTRSTTTSQFSSPSASTELSEAIRDCWKADSWNVNAAVDEDINKLLRCLQSPAPQAYFALRRALDLKVAPGQSPRRIFSVLSSLLKRGYRFAFFSVPANADVFDWKIISIDETTTLEDGWEVVEPDRGYSSTLQIANHLLELSIEASEKHEEMDPTRVRDMVDQCYQRLEITLGNDIRGRSSADAAFCLAVCGVDHGMTSSSEGLYHVLLTICELELGRIGPRSSFPAKNILQLAEKVAASGIRGDSAQPLYSLAANLLVQKNATNDYASAIDSLRDGSFGLFSDRSLLWLWRFAARQTKSKVPDNDADDKRERARDSVASSTSARFDRKNEWITKFKDPSRPLIVDVGCGMGISLLGLSSAKARQIASSSHLTDFPDLTSCNFVGGDLSRLLVGFSHGIAQRWGLEGRTRFVWKPAEDFLQDILDWEKAPPVEMIMIQFPTPFRRESSIGLDGNSQLPSDHRSSGFMVSEKLLTSARDILAQSKGYLLLQSNCEDVAVRMRQMAEAVGMECVEAGQPAPATIVALDGDVETLPLRTQEWIAAGGARALGKGWWSTPILPRIGQTETEVLCNLQAKPVYRCLLTVN
jgi:SAM-dependent methyltransferase